MDIFKLAALAVTAALCALVLRREVPALAVALVLAAGTLLLWQGFSALAAVRGFADALSRTSGLEPQLWAPVWKTAGIGVVTHLAASVCKDAGEGGLAAFLETAGTALALLAALPLVQAMLELLSGLL